MHCFPQDAFTDSYHTLNLSITLGTPWRGSDVLKVPVTCKICKLCGSILWSIVRHDYFWNSMPAKLHIQFLNNSSGICHVKLIHLEERRIIINSNQVVALVKHEQICANVLSRCWWDFMAHQRFSRLCWFVKIACNTLEDLIFKLGIHTWPEKTSLARWGQPQYHDGTNGPIQSFPFLTCKAQGAAHPWTFLLNLSVTTFCWS